jgi:hypothetical protein
MTVTKSPQHFPTIAVVLMLALPLMALAWLGRHHISEFMNPSVGPIIATVSLNNKCGLADHTLIVRDLQTGRWATFRNGVARLRTVANNKVKLDIAPQYTDVALLADPFPAKKQMTLVARCRNEFRFDEIFEK